MRIPNHRTALAGLVGAALLGLAEPGCDSESGALGQCTSGAVRGCSCPTGSEGTQSCVDGSWGACSCAGHGGSGAGGGSTGDGGTGQGASGGQGANGGQGASGAGGSGEGGATPDFCLGRSDGAYCDGADLVTCAAGAVSSRVDCPYGCDDELPAGSQACWEGTPDFCNGKMDGLWCDGDTLVDCQDGSVASRILCTAGCVSMPVGTPDECAVADFCTDVPPEEEPGAPTTACNYMDWELSADGFYLISQFGTSQDPTTWGHSTSCGILQAHYDGYGCRYDALSDTCLDDNTAIDWIQGDVDYDYDTLSADVAANMDGDVPYPEYFYVAGAQRFNCGALLRVSNPESGRCVVAYAEDGGPGTTYEGPDYGGRRILDSSPALVQYLMVTAVGWANSTMMYVEWGLPGDVPGQACTSCESTPAEVGTEAHRTPWDLTHMGLDCR